MITGLDIRTKIVELLHGNFPYRVRPYETEENFEKPSFFIYTTSIRRSSYSNTTDLINMTVTIQLNRMAKQIDLYPVLDRLFQVFAGTIKVKDRRLKIHAVEGTIEEDNLFFDIPISYVESKLQQNEDSLEIMRTLNMNYEEV